MFHDTDLEFGVWSGDGHELGDNLVVWGFEFEFDCPQHCPDSDHQLDFGGTCAETGVWPKRIRRKNAQSLTMLFIWRDIAIDIKLPRVGEKLGQEVG